VGREGGEPPHFYNEVYAYGSSLLLLQPLPPLFEPRSQHTHILVPGAAFGGWNKQEHKKHKHTHSKRRTRLWLCRESFEFVSFCWIFEKMGYIKRRTYGCFTFPFAEVRRTSHVHASPITTYWIWQWHDFIFSVSSLSFFIYCACALLWSGLKSILSRRLKSNFLRVVDLSRPDDIQSRSRVRLTSRRVTPTVPRLAIALLYPVMDI